MADERALRTDAARGSQAKALLENDLHKEAFRYLEAEYIQFWKDTPASEPAARESIWHAVTQLQKVRQHLERVVADGILADAELKTLKDDPHG